MAAVNLSVAERTFIVHGVQDNVRNDGRSRSDFRGLEIETDVVSTASGSARVRLANTDVLVGVKAELGIPDVRRPDQGKLEFFVDCSANAAPAFEGRGGEELSNDISCVLAQTFQDGIDLKALCVAPGKHCWVLFIDILLLECGGNLYDATSIAVKAALFNTRIPNLQVFTSEEGSVEVDLSDDPYDFMQLSMDKAPLLITVNKIGEYHIVDATMEEEACTLCQLVVGVTPQGQVASTKKIGAGSLLPISLIDMLNTAKDVGIALNAALRRKLDEETLVTEKKCSGFLL